MKQKRKTSWGRRLIPLIMCMLMVINAVPAYALEPAQETADTNVTDVPDDGLMPISDPIPAAAAYTITYSDGVEAEEVFVDQVFSDCADGSATPAFEGTPEREGYTFIGWSPEVAQTVTADAVYTAQWKENEPTYNNKPKKKITDADMAKMLIQAYFLGTDEFTSNKALLSLSPSKYKANTVSKYEISEIQGNDQTGYTTTVTFWFEHGDTFESGASETFNTNSNIDKAYSSFMPNWRGGWIYDFDHDAKYGAVQTLTLEYSASMRKWVVPGANNITAAVSNVIKVYMRLPRYDVTYTDGVEDEEIFTDQVYADRANGSATPAFKGTPEREGYTFIGWSPEVTQTVTADAVYTAQWKENEPTYNNKPKKKVTDADVAKMHIRAYFVGTDEFTGGKEFLSLSPSKYKANTVSKYEISEIQGNDQTGYTTTVTFWFEHGDRYESGASETFNTDSVLDKAYPNDMPNWKGDWIYDFDHDAEHGAVQTLTLEYSTSMRKWIVPGASNMTSAVATVIKAYMELPRYDVTYTDGVEDEEIFADQVYADRANGTATPAFEGTPEREGYTFIGWSPEVAQTVTADAVYTAQWKENEPTYNNKPKKKVTDADVAKMQIRAYFVGTDEFAGGKEFLSLSPSKYKANTVSKYEISEIQGNDQTGYTTTVTFWFEHGDTFEGGTSETFNTDRILDKAYPNDMPNWRGDWIYDFDHDAEHGAVQTLTLEYNNGMRKWIVPGSYNMTSAVSTVIKAYMKLPRYDVTYTDGVEDEEIFADQVYADRANGSATPAFEGTPEREGYLFTGWSPEVAETVTADAVYTAQWQEITYNNKPKKKVTDADVAKMQIRAYFVGTDEFTIDKALLSLTPPQYKANTVSKYEIGEIQGNDQTGYTTTVTFWFEHGDRYESGASETFNSTDNYDKAYPNDMPNWKGDWIYDFDYDAEHGAVQTLTLEYSTSMRKWVVPGASNMTSAVANVIKAYMKLPRYDVTYTDGVEDEEIFADQAYTGLANGTVTPAFEGTPEREGYTFTGWSPEVAETVTADAVYTATWTVNEYTITLDANGGSVEPTELKAEYGTELGELPVPTREGYTFEGWKDSEGNLVDETTVVKGEMTLTAEWTVNEYTIRLDANGGNVEPTELKAEYGTELGELPVPTREGYTFEGWTDREGNTVDETTIVKGEMTLIATWTVNEYTITLDANGGSVEPTELKAEYGTELGELPVPTREGYTFGGWRDSEGNAVDETTIVKGEMTLTAEWTVNEYTIRLDANGGSVEPTELKAEYGTELGELPVPTREGYTFGGWKDSEGNAVDETTIVKGEMTLTAEWTVNEYTIRLDANGGSVEPTELKAEYGTELGELPVPTREGYTFEGWKDSEGNTVDETTVVKGEMTLTAAWTAQTDESKTTDTDKNTSNTDSNTPKPDSNTPKTGDNTSPYRSMNMMILCVGIMFSAILIKRKRRA